MQDAVARASSFRNSEQLRDHPRAALVPAPTPGEYRELLADIERRGIVTPLELNGDDVVLDGHQRLKAARELGIASVPVSYVAPHNELEHMLLAALVVELAQVQQRGLEARERRLANLRLLPDVATLPPRGERTQELAARLSGSSPRTIQDALTVRNADPELFEQVRQGRTPAGKAARRIRQRERNARLPEQPVMPEGPFELILADPPWRLEGDPEGAWAPENHYPSMALEQLKAIELPAAEDAVLFLWVACGVLPQALELMAARASSTARSSSGSSPRPGSGCGCATGTSCS